MRNLRIREDTAKYLLNLDPTSAHYDPKSRSMREDPNPMKNPQEKSFMGDNFVRKSGDYHQWEALTLHSFQAHDRGQDMHVQVFSHPCTCIQPVGNLLIFCFCICDCELCSLATAVLCVANS